MPRLMDDTDTFKLGGNFAFTGARVTKLGATEYTLVTILLDVTGSMSGFQDITRKMLVEAVEACKKSPRSDNLLVRVAKFSTSCPGNLTELHGFKPLAEVDPVAYPQLEASGETPLIDAAYNGIAAMNAYAKQLADDADILSNGITFVITDGGESRGCSTATMKMVADEQKKSVSGEIMESHISILIGIDTGYSATSNLAKFQNDAGMDQFIDAGSATPAKLAKLAAFVSKSISSQSQSLGTGGPSQNISATF